MSDNANGPLEKEFEASFRLAAVEVIMTDLMATWFMSYPNPKQAAEAYRERFRNLLAQNPYPEEPDVPSYSLFASGELADAVDRLLEKVEGTTRKRAERRGQLP